MDVYTLLYLKWKPARSYCVAQGTLFIVMWQPGWEGVWGRMGTCICVAESLCCPPETITALLIGNTPILSKSKTIKIKRFS